MYFLLETDYFQKPEPFRTRDVDAPWGYAPSYWIRGRLMKDPAKPIEMELWSRGGGTGLAELFLDSIPLFRQDLVDALVAAGVDNLQAFPAVLTRPDGQKVTSYRAVNILGLVKCADLGKSQYDDIGGTGLVAVAFRKLVIDAAAARNLLFFRLAESVASIIVHERVKAALEPRGFKYLSWRSLAA